MSSKPVIVMNPGAWHPPTTFSIFETELQKRGYETAVTTNVSVGAEPPTKGLDDDVASSRAVISDLVDKGKQVVVVAHSYGGVVASGAVEGLSHSERIKEGKTGGVVALLYIAAFIAPKGQKLSDATKGEHPSWTRVEDDSKIFVNDPVEIFYHDVDPDLARETAALLRHHCTKTFEGVASHEPWHHVPSAYLACEDDRAVPLAGQQAMAGMLGPEAEVVTFKACSHSPFLSRTGETADVVERVARRGVEAVGA
ncbi:hypothetical protein CSOJ01_06394 [Colletotrichum sojae]|uniref:AB hydrolase-1 domain-containing protein n=1 Tax=Colletotrichum sojae TaxID=2175907 RepID=A0A8H6JCR2_9PEZI|nr:hypothetical protein CSOJ01_06394 [Colletotrichum sojae]